MPRSNLRLYFLFPKKGSCFFEKIYEGIKKAEEELKDFNVKVEYIDTKLSNVSYQAQLLSQVTDFKPDGIAIIPSDTTQLNLLIDEAVDTGIPVITFTHDAPYSKRFCHVGPDNYSSGRLCGELMGNFLCSKGNVIVLSGSNQIYGLKQRLLGFKDKIKASYPDIKISKIIDYEDNENTCYNSTIKELTENPAVDGIFVTTASGTMGTAKALKELKLPSPPKVIGHEPNSVISQYLLDGTVHALIFQDSLMQGYLTLKTLYDYLSSGIVPEKENLNTKIQIVLRENLETFLEENK